MAQRQYFICSSCQSLHMSCMHPAVPTTCCNTPNSNCCRWSEQGMHHASWHIIQRISTVPVDPIHICSQLSHPLTQSCSLIAEGQLPIEAVLCIVQSCPQALCDPNEELLGRKARNQVMLQLAHEVAAPETAVQPGASHHRGSGAKGNGTDGLHKQHRSDGTAVPPDASTLTWLQRTLLHKGMHISKTCIQCNLLTCLHLWGKWPDGL